MRRSHIQTLIPVSLLAATLAGCMGQPVSSTAQPKVPVPTGSGVGLDDLAKQPPAAIPGKLTEAQLEQRVAEYAATIERMNAERTAAALTRPQAPVTPQPQSTTPQTTTPPPVQTPAAAPIAPADSGLAALGGIEDAHDPAPTEDKPNLAPITAPLSERFNAATDELAKILRERALSSATPAGEYAVLAWLDTIRPGVLASLDSGPAGHALDPHQKKSINVTREMLSKISTDPKLLNDPDKLWRAFSDAASPITQARDLRLSTAELCSRVDGYGQYVTLSSRTLTAGIPHSVIVYAELDSFSYRKAVEEQGDRYTVDVGQAVEIWQDSDRPTLQKRWSETTIKDVSRRQRRDFYITAMIELPPNLTVGAYNLKVIVKDHLRGSTAEKSIPFVIAADASVATAGN